MISILTSLIMSSFSSSCSENKNIDDCMADDSGCFACYRDNIFSCELIKESCVKAWLGCNSDGEGSGFMCGDALERKAMVFDISGLIGGGGEVHKTCNWCVPFIVMSVLFFCISMLILGSFIKRRKRRYKYSDSYSESSSSEFEEV